MEMTANKSMVKEMLLLIPNLLKLIYRLAEDPRVPKTEKVILAATAAYIVSPLDFIPDVIPFVGKVDDLVIIALALKRLFNVAGADILHEHWDGRQDLLLLVDRILEYALQFIPRRVYDRLVKKVNPDYIDITPP